MILVAECHLHYCFALVSFLEMVSFVTQLDLKNSQNKPENALQTWLVDQFATLEAHCGA